MNVGEEGKLEEMRVLKEKREKRNAKWETKEQSQGNTPKSIAKVLGGNKQSII